VGGLTDVYRVIYNDGENHNALVFKEPTEGKAYKEGQMIMFGNQGQSSFAPVNDEGDIPHREPSGDPNESLGVTWHFAK
jgi:hypothetical protein